MVSIIAMLLVVSSSSMVAAQKSMTQSAMTQSAMFQAIYQGKTDAVQALLDSGVDINMRYEVEGKRGGHTPLMGAVLYLSTPEMIQFLIDSGAEVDAHCDKQATALIYCLGIGSKFFKTLLPVPRGCTRTDAELDRAKYEIVKVLLKNGADVNWARHESDHSDPANRMVRPRDRTDGTTRRPTHVCRREQKTTFGSQAPRCSLDQPSTAIQRTGSVRHQSPAKRDPATGFLEVLRARV
jgi:ankyrin repeat protein